MIIPECTRNKNVNDNNNTLGIINIETSKRSINT